MSSILYPYLAFGKCKKKEKWLIGKQLCVYLNRDANICLIDNQPCIAARKEK